MQKSDVGHDTSTRSGSHAPEPGTPRRAVSVHETPPSVVRAVMSRPTATHVDVDAHETALAPIAGLKVAADFQFGGTPAADGEDSGRANPR